MTRLRFIFIILIIVSLSAFVLGVVFAVPFSAPDFVRVEIAGVPILAEVADTPRLRIKGLSGRDSIPESYGMLFVFESADRHGIWMKGMKFPLDVVWIKNGMVVDMEENLLPLQNPQKDPPVYRPDVPADLILEVNAGFLKKEEVVIGDEVKIFWETKGSDKVSSSPDMQDLFVASSLIGTSTPGSEYFIENLASKPLEGDDFRIGEVLEKTDFYVKHKISYVSDGLLLSGIMNIPSGAAPPDGFPVLILNHGLIRPNIYYSGRGSKREQDFFARNGYVVLHPDYRGYGDDMQHSCPPTLSWIPDKGCQHDFYVGYTRDVLNLIDALEKKKPQFMNLERIGMWGHSMGGGIAARVMVLDKRIRAYVLFAPISADAEDNFYELPQDEIERLIQVYGAGEEAGEIYKKISPLTYFYAVSAPVQLHHGAADSDVPIEFSEKIAEELGKLGKRFEFFRYAGEGHEFGRAWRTAAERSLQFFDRYVRESR